MSAIAIISTSGRMFFAARKSSVRAHRRRELDRHVAKAPEPRHTDAEARAVEVGMTDAAIEDVAGVLRCIPMVWMIVPG